MTLGRLPSAEEYCCNVLSLSQLAVKTIPTAETPYRTLQGRTGESGPAR